MYIWKLLSILGLFFVPTIASADWNHMKSGGAFDGKPRHIILANKSGYALALSCKDADSLMLNYVLPEEVSDDSFSSLEQSSIKLLMRLDNLEIHEFVGEPIRNDGGLVILADNITKESLEELSTAKERLAIVVQIAGESYHETEFNVVGSTKAVMKLKSGCGL